jgi:hypothetical protein
MATDGGRAALERAYCWEPSDRVPKDPETTAFRRAVRLLQAEWRQRNGHPIGTQPIVPKASKKVRLVGSRLPLEYAVEVGANFLTSHALEAARARTAVAEPRQSFDHQRFWADLLWSPTLALNLFGGLAVDRSLAHNLLDSWWSEVPGAVSEVRFAHSPGRLDPSYLNSLRDFDTAIVFDLRGGSRGFVAINTRYHEWAKPETPRPSNLDRYLDVADRSRIFAPGAAIALSKRSGLAEIWLEHLLLLSMLQHDSGSWGWGRFVIVYPERNLSIANACADYRSHLADPTTFSTVTLEQLLNDGVLPASAGLRERYLGS